MEPAAPLPPWQRPATPPVTGAPEPPAPPSPPSRSVPPVPRPAWAARARTDTTMPRKGAPVSMTIRRPRTHRGNLPTPRTPLGRPRGRRAGPGTATVLAAYLGRALLLLAVVVVLHPHHAAVHRLSPLYFLAGEAAAADLATWRQRHRLPLEGATLAVATALAAWGTLRRRPRRLWLGALLTLLGLTVLVTKPQTATSLAARAGTEVPNLLLRAAVTADPTGSVAATPGAEGGRRAVAGRCWTGL